MNVKQLKQYFRIKRSMKACAEMLADQPQKFEGLYEPVYRISCGKGNGSDPFGEWSIRASYIYPESELAEMMKFYSEADKSEKSMKKSAKQLLKCFALAGITRDTPVDGKLTADGLQASAYNSLDGTPIYIGSEINVISAAWYCKGLVAEHGLAGEL